ncbi:MAG: hypothetical protein KatS3mg102_2275 [Planctomycetota bacterium]|nr:MAG: hypothetical protein KatS3mg102_2275 [Planctomycetota bacterium]
MNRGERNCESGSAYLLCLTVLVVVAIASAAFVGMGQAGSASSLQQLRQDALRSALEGAGAVAIQKVQAALLERRLPPAYVRGQVRTGPARGAWWSAIVAQNAARPELYKISLAAALHRETPSALQKAAPYQESQSYPTLTTDSSLPPPEASAVQEVIVQLFPPVPPPPASFKGALSSYYGFSNVKNATINGNDHNLDGTTNPLGDTYAISVASGTVTLQGGSALLAGNGSTLANSVDSTRVDTTYGGDSFPTTPWDVLGIERSTFDQRALRFDTLEAWNAYVESLPEVVIQGTTYRQMPEHSFLNLTFRDGGSAMFQGIYWGSSSHILVWHHPDPNANSDPNAPKGVAYGANIHLGNQELPFHGIAILDDWRHVNGKSNVKGGFVSLNGTGVQEGLQALSITYSSQGIGRALYSAAQLDGEAVPPRVVSYREQTDNAEVRLALDAVQANQRTGEVSPSAGWQEPAIALWER